MARKTRTSSQSEQVMNRINAQMKGNVVTMASDKRYEVSRVPTGSLTFDRLTGGGFARGRHIELYGDWTACKSLIVYQTLVAAQERGEVCALVDGESVFDERWFRALGGDPDALIIYRPRTANELGNVLQLFVQDSEEVKGVDIVAIDSVASLLPQEELDHDFEAGDARVGSLARLMSLLLRKVTSQNDDTLFLWTNQWRDKISRIPGLKSTPGGLSLGFYASTRIEMVKGEKERDARKQVVHGAFTERKIVTGQWINCKVAKEKTGGRPETVKSFLLDFDSRRIDTAREIIDLGMEDGVVERKGDNYITHDSEGKEVKAHGIKRMKAKIDGDEDLREWLVTLIEERTAELGGDDGTG